MINLKNFDRKRLFKSKFIIMGSVFLLTMIISGALYMGIKSATSQKAEKKSQVEGEVVQIKTTKEVITTDELWRDAVENKIKDQAIAQEKKLKQKLGEISQEI